MKNLIIFLSNKKNIIKKIFFTFFIIFIYVLGTNILIPFLSNDYYKYNADPVKYISENPTKFILGKNNFSMDLFFSFRSLNLFSLSIFPYITASIIVQFLQKLLPFFKEWEEQGEKGKSKINLTTRILTLFFAVAQGWPMLIINAKILDKGYYILTLFFLVVGVFICIWLADLITSKGVGNGVSVLIVIGIVGKLFKTFKYLLGVIIKEGYVHVTKEHLIPRMIVLFLFLVLLVLTIILYLGYLKIPINYATDKNDDTIDKYIPIKMNIFGIMPIILADTFLSLTNTIDIFFPKNDFIKMFQESRPQLGIAFFIYLLLILLFSFFSSFMSINPNSISEHLSKQNAYLKDTKPGVETVKTVTHKMFKVVFIGAIFLTLLAASPDIINFVLKQLGYKEVADGIPFGGTSLLIVVGTTIECIQNMKEKNTNVKQTYNKFF
ncbi:SecY family transport protein ['Camptotheca acuminata' phytoplasma]|uniref:SecY family transport protein n=1 Tax='Camptotheca acuminata' phytoplasma TaxID=3239192 RepID=UPI003519D84B